MPVTDQAEHPIRHVMISGPGVDRLDRRKEDGVSFEVSGAVLLERVGSMRDGLMDGVRSILASAPRSPAG